MARGVRARSTRRFVPQGAGLTRSLWTRKISGLRPSRQRRHSSLGSRSWVRTCASLHAEWRSQMKFVVYKDADSVAKAAATTIAEDARAAIAARGRFTLAVSGGHTPWIMLRALAEENIPWAAVHVFQVDERIAPAGHPDRNLAHLRESLLQHAPLPPEQIHAMPVEATDLQAGAAQYALALAGAAG